MAQQTENPATPEVQAELIKLWEDGKGDQFRREVATLVSTHEDYFKVMDIHSDTSKQEVSREEFVKHFGYCFQEKLSNLIFTAVAGRKDTCSIVSMQIFFHGRRTVVKQKEVRKDAAWLWNTLKKLDLKDIDDNNNLIIDREELRNHFKDQLDVAFIDAIFDSIDTDGSGSITPMKYFKWRHNSKLSSIKKNYA